LAFHTFLAPLMIIKSDLHVTLIAVQRTFCPDLMFSDELREVLCCRQQSLAGLGQHDVARPFSMRMNVQDSKTSLPWDLGSPQIHMRRSQWR
jgi:hypothetical protein